MTEPTERDTGFYSFHEVLPKMLAFEHDAVFHAHVEQCPKCKNHIKSMCDEGRRLLDLWAEDLLERQKS